MSKTEVEKEELIDLGGGFDFEIFLAKYKIPLGIALAGIFLISFGVLFFYKAIQPQDKIEIISEEGKASESVIYGDIEGAVEKPGVYQLESGSRLDDLLIKAGGLSAQADREWVEKNLNRAQKLVDGAKFYIPSEGQTTENIVQSGEQVAGSSTNITAKININTASASELDTLWGIGAVRAQDIIESRPYQSVEELKTKKIVPSNVYEKIKDQISVF
jgi:competence protein ComEA